MSEEMKYTGVLAALEDENHETKVFTGGDATMVSLLWSVLTSHTEQVTGMSAKQLFEFHCSIENGTKKVQSEG